MTAEEKEVNRIFAKNLTRFLEDYSMTKAELAKRLGVSAQSVTSWTKGEKSPRMPKVDQMCEIFNCTRSDFLMEYEKDLQLYKKLYSKADSIESAPEGYYTNPETAEIAQEIFDDPDLRTLFHVARNASPEQLKLAKEMLEMMKSNENR